MKISEVAKWKNFTDPDGVEWDLSFLNAHEAVYVHSEEGKKTSSISFMFLILFTVLLKIIQSNLMRRKNG